jgi:hypothetical protein
MNCGHLAVGYMAEKFQEQKSMEFKERLWWL